VCLPLLWQGKLGGVLYLENSRAAYAFPADRVAMLDTLAVRAAIALENARLYGDLQDRESRIRRLVDANIIGIIIWTVDGRILEANDAFLAIIGYDRQELEMGQVGWTDLTPPEWSDVDARALEQVIATGRQAPFEKEYFRKDGSRVPVLIGVATFSAEPNEGVAFILDLSERKKAEERQKVMVNELNHRVKNTLATVQSIAVQSLRPDRAVAETRDAFVSRLLALSGAHNLLNAEHWESVDLEAIVRLMVAPYDDPPGARFAIAGPRVRLQAQHALGMAMALNELGANAAKYGALSVAEGRVSILWRSSAAGDVRFLWQEEGGPAVAPPARRGFGTRLIQQGLARELGGEAQFEFRLDGLRCEIAFRSGALDEGRRTVADGAADASLARERSAAKLG